MKYLKILIHLSRENNAFLVQLYLKFDNLQERQIYFYHF